MRTSTSFSRNQDFESEVEVARVGRHLVALACSSMRDAGHRVLTSQALLTIDDEPALARTLWIDGDTCSAVLDFGPGLGAGRLALHWSVLDDAAGPILHGHGSWNDAPLAAFAGQLDAARGIDAGLKLSFADGTVFAPTVEAAAAAVLADFAPRVSAEACHAIGLCPPPLQNHGEGGGGAMHGDPRVMVDPARMGRAVLVDSLALSAVPLGRRPDRPHAKNRRPRSTVPTDAASAAPAA